VRYGSIIKQRNAGIHLVPIQDLTTIELRFQRINCLLQLVHFTTIIVVRGRVVRVLPLLLGRQGFDHVVTHRFPHQWRGVAALLYAHESRFQQELGVANEARLHTHSSNGAAGVEKRGRQQQSLAT
jgi:hypothetical protein